MLNRPVRVAIIAAETSGDLLGAGLIYALRRYYPQAEFIGVAGENMLNAGCKSLISIEQLSVMGIIEVAKRLPKLLKIRCFIRDYFIQNPPDVYIGIDAPDFNLPIEKALKAKGITTVHYVSPTVWAWREKRINAIAKSVNMMLALFPFEAAFYEKHQVPVRFVGHPLADSLSCAYDTESLRKQFLLPQKAAIITLMPGSRKGELTHIAPTFIKAAQQCLSKKPDLMFLAPMVNATCKKQFEACLNQYAPNLPIKVIIGQSRDAIAVSDVVLLASGTATLETLLLGKPMVVGYKVPFINYCIGKWLIKLDKFALPNLLASRNIVPEFIQKDCHEDNLSQAILKQLENLPLAYDTQQQYEKIHNGLQRNANEQAAVAICKLLEAQDNGDRIEL